MSYPHSAETPPHIDGITQVRARYRAAVVGDIDVDTVRGHQVESIAISNDESFDELIIDHGGVTFFDSSALWLL